MVKLLHHYETQSNRIFLLLEHITNGLLGDHIYCIRKNSRERKRKKVRDTTISDRVVIGQESTIPNTTNTANTGTNDTLPTAAGANYDIVSTAATGTANDSEEKKEVKEEEESYVESLLEQLTVPSTKLPTDSITSVTSNNSIGSDVSSTVGGGEDDDMLVILRRQVEELDNGEKETEQEIEQGTEKETEKDTEKEKGEETGEAVIDDNELMQLLENKVTEEKQQMIELEQQLLAFTTLSLPPSITTNEGTTTDTEREEVSIEETLPIEGTLSLKEETTSLPVDLSSVTPIEGLSQVGVAPAEDVSQVGMVNIVPPTPTTPTSESVPIPNKQR